MTVDEVYDIGMDKEQELPILRYVIEYFAFEKQVLDMEAPYERLKELIDQVDNDELKAYLQSRNYLKGA